MPSVKSWKKSISQQSTCALKEFERSLFYLGQWDMFRDSYYEVAGLSVIRALIKSELFDRENTWG